VRTKQCNPGADAGGRPIKKDGGEMLIAIVLDRPLAEAKALVEAPDAFIQQSLGSCKIKESSGYCTNDPAGCKR
jgi:hypothetical protein